MTTTSKLAAAAGLCCAGVALAQPIAAWNMQSIQEVGSPDVRGNPVVGDLAGDVGVAGGNLRDHATYQAFRGGDPIDNGDDALWYFSPVTNFVYTEAMSGAPADFYNASSLFGTGDGISYDASAAIDPNLDPGVGGVVEGVFYPIDNYGNEFELLSTYTMEFMFRSNGDTTDNNGDGEWTSGFAPSGGPSTDGFFVPANDAQVIWWHDGPARMLLIANETSPGGLIFAFTGVNGLTGDNDFAIVRAETRNYLNGDWVYVRYTYDESSPEAQATFAGAQVHVEITTDTDPGPGVSLVTDRFTGNFNPFWNGLRAGQGGNPLVGLRGFGNTFNGAQFRGVIDAIQITEGFVDSTTAMGNTVPAPSFTDGPVVRWSMDPSFTEVVDPNNPAGVFSPGEGGVNPVTLDTRTAPGEGDQLGGHTAVPTFPYGSADAVGQTSGADDHLFVFTGEDYDMDGFTGDFPVTGAGAPAAMFAPGMAPASVNSFDSDAFSAPAIGGLVYPSDRFGDELAFQGSFTLETVYNTSSSANQIVLFQGEARERYRLRVTSNGLEFNIIDEFGTNDGASLTNATVNHVGGAWVYSRATFDESTQTISLASVDEFGNEDAVTVNCVAGFGNLPTGSDGNMFIGRDFFDPLLSPQNFRGLIDEVQIHRGVIDPAEALVSLSTDPVGGCNPADISMPFGQLDLSDVQTFLIGFGNMEPVADIAGGNPSGPDGMFDLQDVQTFLIEFGAGCP